MIDEQFMRDWNAGHRRFSASVAVGADKLGRRFGRRGRDRRNIGNAYDIPADVHGPGLSAPILAAARGFAAGVITLVLWVTVMAVATPAPVRAMADGALAASSACALHPALA
ncbi:MAG TPA: hypothetical protein VEB68_14055 [Croceibacterium sp.]|nr:hypothetical protein [Croceibacterium sp.]